MANETEIWKYHPTIMDKDQESKANYTFDKIRTTQTNSFKPDQEFMDKYCFKTINFSSRSKN